MDVMHDVQYVKDGNFDTVITDDGRALLLIIRNNFLSLSLTLSVLWKPYICHGVNSGYMVQRMEVE